MYLNRFIDRNDVDASHRFGILSPRDPLSLLPFSSVLFFVLLSKIGTSTSTHRDCHQWIYSHTDTQTLPLLYNLFCFLIFIRTEFISLEFWIIFFYAINCKIDEIKSILNYYDLVYLSIRKIENEIKVNLKLENVEMRQTVNAIVSIFLFEMSNCFVLLHFFFCEEKIIVKKCRNFY